MRALTAVLLVVSMTAFARADSGVFLGETSRTAALAGAVTALAGEPGNLAVNPAALADLDTAALTLSAQLGHTYLWFRRTGEAEEREERWLGGFGLALAAPLPGPEWLRRVRLGLALHLPAEHLLRVDAPERVDSPVFARYGSRLDRLAATVGLGIEVTDWLGVGIGVTLSPTLPAPTRVDYEAGRGNTPDENVVVRLDRTLELGGAFLAGLRVQPLPALGLGLTYREAVTARAFGPHLTTAGSIRVDDQLDFFAFWEPAELAAGVAVAVAPVNVAADLVWARWSEFRSVQNEAPDPPFEDVLDLRLGVEWAALDWLDLRAGYAFERSPVPAQSGVTNFLDGNRHVPSVGTGFDLRPATPLAIDLHVRGHVLATQQDDKDPAELPDADPDREGRQTINLGFPGIESGGGLWQAGLTISLFLGAGP